MKKLTQLLQEKKNLLSIFFTAGFPALHDTEAIIAGLSASNVDFIEVGLPFSDPLADGPTIQGSSQIALQNGMNLDIVFEQLKHIQAHNTTPLVLMGYVNQLLKYGPDAFCKACVDSGIETLILPDLPLVEYEQQYQQLFQRYGLSHVFLITPHTSEARIRKIDAYTDAFIYVVASASITGAKGAISEQQVAYFERIKAMNLQSKLIVGFGISDRETFATACQYADGAIIGSAFIKHLEQEGIEAIDAFIAPIRA